MVYNVQQYENWLTQDHHHSRQELPSPCIISSTNESRTFLETQIRMLCPSSFPRVEANKFPQPNSPLSSAIAIRSPFSISETANGRQSSDSMKNNKMMNS